MRPLYVVGTHLNVGNTTTCIGLIGALRRRGLKVGYMKPLGQRLSTYHGETFEDDTLVIVQGMDLKTSAVPVAVALGRGRVEEEVRELHVAAMSERILEVFEDLQAKHDLVIVEAMGHVAAGSCLKLSAGDLAKLLDARVLLISGGGIGSTIDDISLCATFLIARGAYLIGAVVNKVWPEKYRRVHEATRKGLDNLGIRSFGTLPYERTLAFPTMRQVTEQLDGKVLCGQEAMTNRVGEPHVAAMEPQHMVGYLRNRTLVITPGDRSDNILAILSVHMLEKSEEPPVSGIIMAGGFRPAGKVMSLLAESRLPVILCRGTTHSVAATLQDMVFKIKPDDEERIDAALCLVSEYMDVDGIVAGLTV